MKIKFKTPYNLDEFPPEQYEHDFGPSLTDDTGYQTIDQIIERCQRGVPLSVATYTPEYEISENITEEMEDGILDSLDRGVDSPDFDLADIPEFISTQKHKNNTIPKEPVAADAEDSKAEEPKHD